MMKKWWIIVFLFFIGCGKPRFTVSAGRDFRNERLNILQRGSSKKVEVYELLGEPYSVTEKENREVWQYYVKLERSFTDVYVVIPIPTKETIIKRATLTFEGDVLRDFDAKTEYY